MEDKKFFVKDFIQYCSPCFACDHPITFRFGFEDKGVEHSIPDDLFTNSTNAIVTDKYVEVELSVRYRTNLKMWIYHRTNKVITSDDVSFSDYLSKRNLFLYCSCSLCRSGISSQYLKFQNFNRTVTPTTLRREMFNISVKNRRYSLDTDYIKGTSVGRVRTYTAPNVSGPDLIFNMQLLPKYKLGNRQKLIDKLNTYAIFS